MNKKEYNIWKHWEKKHKYFSDLARNTAIDKDSAKQYVAKLDICDKMVSMHHQHKCYLRLVSVQEKWYSLATGKWERFPLNWQQY